ncbi:MAG: hypothetical protein P4L10_17575 [Acidobacteriaceae bacterium]|nr:hypothetical protein [Acidobacteriaceae bacterium]
MNHIISSDPVIAEFNLKKIVQYWGIKEGDYAYYMLGPPWLRLDPKETLNTLYADPTRSSAYSQKYNPAQPNVQLYSKAINIP